MCTVYDKMRHKKSKLKSLFSKKSNSKQRCRSKLVKSRKFKSNINKKEICVSNGRSTSLTPPPSKFIRKSGVSKGVI